MNLSITDLRDALQELKEKITEDLNESAAVGFKCFGTYKVDLDAAKALAAIDILDSFLFMEKVSEDMDTQDYTDEEICEPNRCNNAMAILIETDRIKLTPTPNGRGVGCAAYRDSKEENACCVCHFRKTCFGGNLPFKDESK